MSEAGLQAGTLWLREITRFCRQRSNGQGDKGEAVREVIAGARDQLHAARIPAGDNPEPVVLDFVNPLRTHRRRFCRTREAGFDYDGRTAGTLRQH